MYLLIWLAFIAYASLSPADEIPKFKIQHFDKIVHFCLYFGFVFLLIPIVLNTKKIVKSYVIAVVIAATSGIIFELLQYYMAIGRTASVYDELANATGALIGTLIYHLIIRKKRIEKLIFKIE